MKAHDLAKQLLKAKNLEVTASIDISSNDEDYDRRLFTNSCYGVNSLNGDGDCITILFQAEPIDNYENKI